MITLFKLNLDVYIVLIQFKKFGFKLVLIFY